MEMTIDNSHKGNAEVHHKEIVYNKYYVNKITPLYCVFY